MKLPYLEKPYLYLRRKVVERQKVDIYECYIAIYLKGHKVINDPSKKIRYSDSLNRHDNPGRTMRPIDNHHYSPHLKRTIIEVVLDKDEFEGWYTTTVEIPFDKIYDMKPQDRQTPFKTTDVVQVIMNGTNVHADHDGSSIGHYGDAD